jgi:hypothetical protein
MQLLTKIQTTNASLAAEASACANHLASAAVHANRMVEQILALSDDDLTEWLNSRPPQDTAALFAAHGQLGEHVNAATQTAAAVLQASGIRSASVTIDTRSVAEKLASQNRVLHFDDQTGIFQVTTTPPPEPEPENEP